MDNNLLILLKKLLIKKLKKNIYSSLHSENKYKKIPWQENHPN